MVRLTRLYAPGIPQLVQARLARPLALAHQTTPAHALNQIQGWLAAETRRHDVALHGWAIVPDRIALLASASEPQALSRVIQGLGRHMAAAMTHGRVFHDRYHNALVDESWMSACLVWTESLPVTLGVVDIASRWPWSSAQAHVGQAPPDPMLKEHPCYWALGNTPFSRQARHQELLAAGLPPSQRLRIEQALQGQWALGDASFVARMTQRGSRRAAPGVRGRPRKATPEA